jgi:hypothetical protein
VLGDPQSGEVLNRQRAANQLIMVKAAPLGQLLAPKNTGFTHVTTTVNGVPSPKPRERAIGPLLFVSVTAVKWACTRFLEAARGISRIGAVQKTAGLNPAPVNLTTR